jgi:photosystem II stability/assembly factor-like uncharacterized protein
MAMKTYYVTRNPGEVRRLDDLTLPWLDVSVPLVVDNFNDIMAFPGDPLKVIAVGRQRQIYWSTDAGATWTQSVGDYTALIGSDSEFFEIWIIDDLVSYVVGTNGACVKSIDGGITYNLTATLPTGSGNLDGGFNAKSVHFIDPLNGVVGVDTSGNGAVVFKTTDGGATWTWLLGGGFLGGAPGTSFGPNGIFMSADQQVIVVETNDTIYRSTDAGVSFPAVFDLTTIPQPGGNGLHLTWLGTDPNEMYVTGNNDRIFQSLDNGATWAQTTPVVLAGNVIDASHFYQTLTGFTSGDPVGSTIYHTVDGGSTKILSESAGNPLAIWTEMDGPPPACYRLLSCNTSAYPNIEHAQGDVGVDLMSVIGQVISTLDQFGTERCYTVELQVDVPCDTTGGEFIVLGYTVVGNDCASFDFDACPVEIPLTIVGEVSVIDVVINNTGVDAHDFSFALGSCTTTEMTVLTPSPINIPGGGSGIIQIEYAPVGAENGQCELNVTGPCGVITCDVCFHSVAVPDCPHFNICITGPSCAPDCIKPGEIISFDLGGSISPVAYPTVITFQVVNQVTQEVVFTIDYAVADDTELDAIVINVPGLPPGKYCAEVCLPGCNTKRVLCFDVCEPFDLYKDSCNHWHVHRPAVCQVEEFLVCVRPMECGAPEEPIIEDVLWDVSQDNTFEFEVPGDGIFIFEMKDPVSGEVLFSFAAFETCALQECWHILMDKIMCSCSDPCCKRCDGSPEQEREFARMTLNKLVPLYLMYLGMARRNELYTVGMKLISDDHHCFLHDACVVLAKINDIIMDCGCLCPEQKNTATNRGDCQSC